MGTLLRIIIILLGLWLVLRLVKQALDRRKTPAPPSSPVDEMRPCAHCGVHLPRSQAIIEGGRVYCCEEHRRLGSKSG